MHMKKLLTATFALAALAAAPTSLGSLLYEFDKGPGNFGGSLNAKQKAYNSISTSYNTNGTLTFGTDFGKAPADGFWLVVNDSANPKGHSGLAIFYGNIKTGKLVAYEYTGANNARSWAEGPEIADYGKAIEKNGRAFSFSIDVNQLNADLAIGAKFGEKVGIWYHPTWGTKMKNNGPLNFSYKRSGWYDVGMRHTTVTDVPEPGTIALFGSALLGLFGLRRKRLA